MGKKSPPAPPAAPDPEKTARAQATANKEAAIAQSELNMVNQQTPFGSLTYEQVGRSEEGTPRYQATQELSPEQQAILDQQNQAALGYGQTANRQLGAVSDLLSQPLDYSGLGAAPTLNEGTRDEVRQSMIERNQPQFDRRREQIESRLASQGIMDPGSEAYQAAVDEYYRSLNDFELAAEQAALGQASQLYGIEANQRDREINELIQQRSQPLNELAAMMTGAQVQNPQFVNTPATQVNPTDVMGATYGSANLANQQYQQQIQNQAANRQGLYSLLGSAAMAGGYAFSDRRLKTDISHIGHLESGLPVYAYRYKWGGPKMVGVMADEAEQVFPHAVATLGGFKMVNYGKIR